MSQGPHPSPAHHPSLLLVDQRETTRDVFARVLRHHGFDVEIAPDLTRAMELSRQRSFDLLVSNAPGRSAATGDLARLLKLLYAQGRTAGTFELDMVDELAVGYEVFVIRPVASESLLANLFKTMTSTPAWSSGHGEA